MHKRSPIFFAVELEKRSIQILVQRGVILEQVCWKVFKSKGNNSLLASYITIISMSICHVNEFLA